MDKAEFERRLAALPSVEPDEMDKRMMAIASRENDDTSISHEELRQKIEGVGCNGKISLRLPRTLHRELREQAKSEGVSLNQYILYKLAK